MIKSHSGTNFPEDRRSQRLSTATRNTSMTPLIIYFIRAASKRAKCPARRNNGIVIRGVSASFPRRSMN